ALVRDPRHLFAPGLRRRPGFADDRAAAGALPRRLRPFPTRRRADAAAPPCQLRRRAAFPRHPPGHGAARDHGLRRPAPRRGAARHPRGHGSDRLWRWLAARAVLVRPGAGARRAPPGPGAGVHGPVHGRHRRRQRLQRGPGGAGGTPGRRADPGRGGRRRRRHDSLRGAGAAQRTHSARISRRRRGARGRLTERPRLRNRAMANALVWFRNDLRLADQPALAAALAAGQVPLCVYVHAPEEEGDWPPGAASNAWRHHSLAALDADLRARGSRLRIFCGPSLAVLQALAAACDAEAVYWTRRYEPVIERRDAGIKRALREQGLHAESFNGALLFEPWQLATKQGEPYRVFTPFWRTALAHWRDHPLLDAPA